MNNIHLTMDYKRSVRGLKINPNSKTNCLHHSTLEKLNISYKIHSSL